MKKKAAELEKGIFVISIDYEYAWGYADTVLTYRDWRRIGAEADIVRRLIKLFETYDIPATWAIVGHLLEHNCDWNGGLPHASYQRPIIKGETRDWFFQHPEKGNIHDSLWFDVEGLIDQISHSAAKHEVASHSYAHILYDEERVTKQVIDVDLENMKRIHMQHDLPYNSFVFPRNIEGFHEELKKADLQYFRGKSKKWYDSFPLYIKKLGHVLDYLLPFGRVVVPHFHSSGLINIPDSMLLLGRNGLRKIITPEKMIKKAKTGLRKAVQKNKVFHLWFHPSNFSYDTEVQFEIFESILKEVSILRKEGKLSVMTMSDVGAVVKKSN